MEGALETDRLTLRQFTPEDVENLVELDGDPEVMRYINGGRPTPRQEIERRELPAFLAYRAGSATRLRQWSDRRSRPTGEVAKGQTAWGEAER